MIKGIEHVAIQARDSAGLKDWYVKMFGWKVVYDNAKGTFFLMAPDQSLLEIISTEESGVKAGLKAGGIRHIALTVEQSDFDPMVAKLKNARVEVVTDVTASPNGNKTFFFRDPEGNIFHLIYRPEPLS